MNPQTKCCFNKTKAFTLIELLAVIVVLAIIALIATPTVFHIIETANKGAAVDSAYEYIDAIEYHNAMSMLNSDEYLLIEDGENLDIKNLPDVQLKGNKPTSGTISIQKTLVTTASICINNYNVEYDGNEAIATSKCNTKTNNNLESGNIIVSDELKELLEKTNHTVTVNDILSSETAMQDILSNEENVDYIINNYYDYSSIVLGNKNVFEIFLNNNNLLNKILYNSKWTTSILANEKVIDILDSSNPVTTPIMSSNNSPSGEVIFSSAYSGYPAYKAFDKDLSASSYWSVGPGLSYKNQYIGYCFDNEIWVYKFDIQFPTSWQGRQDTDFVVEAANDKNSESWDIIKSGLHESTTKQTIIMDNYNKKYKCYRVRLLSEIAQYGSNNTVIYELEFYGK